MSLLDHFPVLETVPVQCTCGYTTVLKRQQKKGQRRVWWQSKKCKQCGNKGRTGYHRIITINGVTDEEVRIGDKRRFFRMLYGTRGTETIDDELFNR